MPWPDGRPCKLPGHSARPSARLTALVVLALASLWLYLVGSMAEGNVARPVMKRSSSSGTGGASSADYSGENRMQRSLALYRGMHREFWISHKRGVTLEITSEGVVRGITRNPNSNYAILESIPLVDGVNGSAYLNGENATTPSLLALKGKVTKRYLCMNNSGKAYSVVDSVSLSGSSLSDDCKWEENFLENSYITYCRDRKRKRKKLRKKKRKRKRRMCLGVNENEELMNGLRVDPTRDEAMFQNRPTDKTVSSPTFNFDPSTTPQRPLVAPTPPPRGNRRRRRKNRKRLQDSQRRSGSRPCTLFCVGPTRQGRKRHHSKRRKSSRRRHRSRTRTPSTSWPLLSGPNH